MRLNNKVYDFLKWLCLICLPAFSVFYAALDSAFGWGNVQLVTTIVAAVGAFIGSLIGVSTAEYKKDVQNDAES